MESLEVKLNMTVAQKTTSLTAGKFSHSTKIIVLYMQVILLPGNGSYKLVSFDYVGQESTYGVFTSAFTFP